MKRKYINAANTPRKKRKFNVNDVDYDGNNNSNNSNNNNNTKMVCVICLSEMPSPSLHEHYSKYHNELLVSTTSNFANVIKKCKENNIVGNNNNNNNDTNDNKLSCGDNDKFRSKLQLLRKEEEKKKNEKKNKNKTKNKPIKFNVPRFELNMDSNDKKNDETQELIANITTAARPLVMRDTDNGYESIIESLRKFENNSHELSYLLSQDSLNISTISQCKLLIKILFEQLWNARKICDEQILFIKYINMIDIGNRMQISFLLNQLKQNHNHIYHDLYQKLRANPNWQTWKNLRFNDKKINYLRQNIEKIKQNQQELICNDNKIQLQTIHNLKNQQSAAVQSYDLCNNEVTNANNNNSNNFFTDYEKKKRCSAALSSVDFSAALSSVDCINAPSHAAPRPDIVDLIDDVDENENENDADEEEWILIIKKLLNEFKLCMDLREINEKLQSLRYCSEFDVLNDMLCVNKVNKSKEIKLRFCHYFGNLSDWSFKRLIKWCQTNKFYQICQKIRSKKINGKQFIDIVTNITSVRRFFNNLTSPQIIQIYNKINLYLEDALSIL